MEAEAVGAGKNGKVDVPNLGTCYKDLSMKLRVIKSAKQHRLAVKEAERLFNAGPRSARADRLELLVLLIEDYEKKHFPFPGPDAIEAIKFRMEQRNLTTSDLAKVLGGRSRVSEVLRRKRPLSLTMIKNLHKKWQIPAEALLAG